MHQVSPSEISIIHFHTFPWEHTVGFEGGAGNLNAPAVWKEESDQQLSGGGRMEGARHLTLQVYYHLSNKEGFFPQCRLSKYSEHFLCLLPCFLLDLKFIQLWKIYHLMLHISKKSLFSAISFSSINKPDSSLSFSALIYDEWFEGLKTASADLFVFLVKGSPPSLFCCCQTTC